MSHHYSLVEVQPLIQSWKYMPHAAVEPFCPFKILTTNPSTSDAPLLCLMNLSSIPILKPPFCIPTPMQWYNSGTQWLSTLLSITLLALPNYQRLAVQSHADLPITLVLGLSTSPAILDQLLPGPCLALLQPQTFPLASAPARVDALLCATLLGSQCPGFAALGRAAAAAG